MYKALPYLEERDMYSIHMPNKWNWALDYPTFIKVRLAGSWCANQPRTGCIMLSCNCVICNAKFAMCGNQSRNCLFNHVHLQKALKFQPLGLMLLPIASVTICCHTCQAPMPAQSLHAPHSVTLPACCRLSWCCIHICGGNCTPPCCVKGRRSWQEAMSATGQSCSETQLSDGLRLFYLHA